MTWIKRSLLACITLFSVGLFAQSEYVPKAPSPARLYNNLSKEYPNFLSNAQASELEGKLEEFARTTSNQIVVVIVDDLNGMDPATYATELGHKWKVGQGKFDNGIVLLVKPTGGQNQRKVQIAIGYGLEGAIPDLTAKQIVENELIPNFKDKQFYKGIDAATTVLMSLAIGEYNSQKYLEDIRRQQKIKKIILVIVVLIVLVFLVIRNQKGGGGDGMTMSSRGFFWGSMMGGMGGRGGSSGGGFGGGGFGGFGGGGFGGGGAGGSW